MNSQTEITNPVEEPKDLAHKPAPKKTSKSPIKRQRDRYREKVKGMFKFYEVPGGNMSFVYKAYKGDPVVRYDMLDGEVYTIPYGVAVHLHNRGKYPVHSYMRDESGKASMKVGRTIDRFGFHPLDFIYDEEDIDSSVADKIITVEKMG